MARKLLMDVDPGSDDAVALAVALASPEIDLVGVTTVAGNTTIENTTRNALAILDYLGGTTVPVARGCDRPLVDELNTAEHIHGPGGLRGDIPEPSSAVVDVHASEFIIETAREFGDELTIAAVGPLTNLAVAVAIEPDLPEVVDDIHFMGGAAFTAGNITAKAEFNMHTDPVAGRRVVQDTTPAMVGLDVTNHATIPPATTVDFGERDGRLKAIASWLGYTGEGGERTLAESPSIHDAVVIANLIGDILEFQDYPVDIDTTGGPCHGAVVADQREGTDKDPNVSVAIDIDVDGFRDIVTGALARLE